MGMSDSELVDVLCIGSGSAALAAAIAAASTGLSVFVAEPRRRTSHPGPTDDSWTTVLQRQWGAKEFNTPTATYLDELTHDLGPPQWPQTASRLPIGSVETFEDSSVDHHESVPPFYGHEIAQWARDCLSSPYGLVCSRVTPSTLAPLQMRDGTAIRAAVIAEVPPTRRSGMTLRQWLRDMASEKGITIHDSTTVRRLIFNDGQLVGAMLDTPLGINRVRARRVVLLGTSNPMVDDRLAMYPASVLRDGRLSLVSRTASRFARLELLTTAENVRASAPPGRLA